MRRELARILGRLIEAGFPDTESTGSERDEAPPSSTTTTPTAGVTRAPGAGGETRAWRGAIVAVTGGATAYLIPFRAEFVSLLMTLLADEAVVVSDEAARLLAELGEVRELHARVICILRSTIWLGMSTLMEGRLFGGGEGTRAKGGGG